jgi:TonB-linked SusC/RagA family outer membrane protein
MKVFTRHFLPDGLAMPRLSFTTKLLQSFVLLLFVFTTATAQEKVAVSGTVLDSAGRGIPGVTVTERGTKNAVVTTDNGIFSINVAGAKAVLVFSSVSYTTKQVTVGTQTTVNMVMESANTDLGEVVVIGYGTRKKESLTGAISTITSKDFDRVHAGSNVSTGLAGKLPGVTFRMPDGRPGSSARIQIRNMGTPLYVIDGIQQDEGQFNNLASNDIESITVLKDASAAIYGVRAANGVVVVTTKRGAAGRNNVNISAYTGWQTWFRFPHVVNNSYDYMRYRAEAEINSNGSTGITQAELEKYKQGESAGPQYRSFDWREFILKDPAPLTSANVNISGGTDKVNYYVSATNLSQKSNLGKEYRFNRANIQSNVTAKLASGLRVGMDINGRIETRQNPGVPGGDDYWLARFAVMRNTPRERPYANDNPAYLNDMGEHLETNYAFLNEKISGKLRSDWRVLQTNFNAEWAIPAVPGLVIKGVGSYYIADNVLNNQEYTYKAYTYRPATDAYDATGGSSNPWREREQIKQINTTLQGQINYNNTFGNHTVGATLVAERLTTHRQRNWTHTIPISNNLPLLYFPTMDRYIDNDNEQRRLGYIGRLTYSYDNKYFIEASGRRDASYLFAPGQRIGYFPGVSAGWRITEEPWMKQLLGDGKVLTDLKFRASYGELGDDAPNGGSIVAPYAYLQGYTYNQLENPNDPNSNPLPPAILDGNPITISRDKGIPVTGVSWLKSKITDIGADFSFLNGKLTGSIDYFYRKRTGLVASKNDVIVPVEVGYGLPAENVETDAQFGGEISLAYNNKIGEVSYNVSGNFSYTRSKFISSYKPTNANSWDQYRNSREGRYTRLDWGYEVIGQFKSVEEINNYPVNIDGRGNKSLLPGDLIYKDLNGDGKLDGYDERPIGYGLNVQPNINFGFSIGLAYRSFDFHADFSGAAGYSWNQNWELRWAFQNNGNLNTIFEDRWHRADPYDVNSAWIPGKYPANRYNPGNSNQSNYDRNSTFWIHNVKQLRARTIEVGYTLPSQWLSKVKIQRCRVYANAYNLFSIDNLREYDMDPEVVDDNGLQFPQNKVLNIGFNLSF